MEPADKHESDHGSGNESNNLNHDQRLSEQLRSHATRFDASKELHASIRAQVTLKSAMDTRPQRTTSVLSGSATVLAWRSAAAGLLAGVALTLAAGLLLGARIEALITRPSLENMLVSQHVLSMGHGPLFEVASSDRHTVKPWYQGKLAFSPPVPDLTSAGFVLLGGRIDHIEGKAVAALVYQHKLHLINVFIWPSQQKQDPQFLTDMGFNLSQWSDGAMQVWLVSDVDASELRHMGQAWREQSMAALALSR